MIELEQSPIEFLVYLMSSAIDSRRGNRVLRQVRRSVAPVDMDDVDAQDEAIRAIEQVELQQLETQEEEEGVGLPSDISDEDYWSIPRLPP